MTEDNSKYAGLKLKGVHFINRVSGRSLACPFCGSDEPALLAGLISLSARIHTASVSEDQKLAGFLCPSSHLFFVRECDVSPADGNAPSTTN
jgi:hypothetical protein